MSFQPEMLCLRLARMPTPAFDVTPPPPAAAAPPPPPSGHAAAAALRQEWRRAPAARRAARDRPAASPAEHRHRADAQQAAQPAQHPAATARPRAAARERHLLAGEHLHQRGRDPRRDDLLDGRQERGLERVADGLPHRLRLGEERVEHAARLLLERVEDLPVVLAHQLRRPVGGVLARRADRGVVGLVALVADLLALPLQFRDARLDLVGLVPQPLEVSTPPPAASGACPCRKAPASPRGPFADSRSRWPLSAARPRSSAGALRRPRRPTCRRRASRSKPARCSSKAYTARRWSRFLSAISTSFLRRSWYRLASYSISFWCFSSSSLR